jgi:tetratricopeptide (TPR) repeat protein
MLSVGGYSMERLQLEPGFLRRTPRWELWGSRGGYNLFRRAVMYQEEGQFAKAHQTYEQASGLSLGNVRIATYRASLFELEGKYAEAIVLYDAVHCLWKKNIEVLYRASSVRVNRVHEILARSPALIGPAGLQDRLLDHAQREQELASGNRENLPEVLVLMAEAQRIMARGKADLHYPEVLWRWLKTWLPRRRDIGERIYWASWLRRDNFRQPLMLLRRSKRYEYTSAMRVAEEANRILRFLVERKIQQEEPAFEVSPFDIDDSSKAVIMLIRKKRLGWLAHWTAACYFSRAAEAADLAPSHKWQEYKKRFIKDFPGLTMSGQVGTWREFCEAMAVSEIGRVLRNPCNQLNPELLDSDPDMKRLHHAFKGSMVRGLIGPLPSIARHHSDQRKASEHQADQAHGAAGRQRTGTLPS